MTFHDVTTTGERITKAVSRNPFFSLDGALERLFAFAFQGLVYPLIWEDPAVDMAALKLTQRDRVVAIASGGCNVLSYLTATPASISAVDLSPAHVALGQLKAEAVRRLPDYASLKAFLGDADRASNPILYRTYIRAHLDDRTRTYWDSFELPGRRRIDRFARGFYQTGLLGRFIFVAHLTAKLLGVDLKVLMRAKSIEEQRAYFDTTLRPAIEGKLVRALVSRRATLFGLGIPPQQYEALADDAGGDIVKALLDRTERLACGFALKDNWFARQAFGRSFGQIGTLPPYLERENYETVRSNIRRASFHNENLTDFLSNCAAGSQDCYVLLDAQDWMTKAQLEALWRQINRTARPGARVIFRSAAKASPLDGALSHAALSKWENRSDEAARLHALDRSAIYGGFHLLVRKA